MIYAGFDVHKKFSQVAVMDEKGTIIDQARIVHANQIADSPWKQYLQKFSEPISASIEATQFWAPVYEAIEPFVQQTKLAHPLKTRIIGEARVKTDKISAELLAHLDRTNLLPCAYIPPQEIRDGRELLRYRASLVSLQTMVKNRIQSVLFKCGYLYEGTDVFGKKGLTWLKSLPLREVYQQEIQSYLRILTFLKQEIKRATKRIHKELAITPSAQLIQTLYGIGKYLALLITMEAGEISRFSHPSKLVSYAGLSPAVYSSGGKTHYGSITKQGSKWLRWALILATQKYKRHKGILGDFYRRIEQRHGSKAARVALARKLATIIWHMLSKNTPFDENVLRQDRLKRIEFKKGTVAPRGSDR